VAYVVVFFLYMCTGVKSLDDRKGGKEEQVKTTMCCARLMTSVCFSVFFILNK